MYADTQLAQAELGWSAQTLVEQMCKPFALIIGRMPRQGSLLLGEDFWRWQTMMPYKKQSLTDHKNMFLGRCADAVGELERFFQKIIFKLTVQRSNSNRHVKCWLFQ